MTKIGSFEERRRADSEEDKKGNPKTRRGVILAVIVTVLLIGGAIWRSFVPAPIVHGMVLQSPTPLADFSLESSEGRSVHLSDFRGQYLLITFGYTSCPDVCPLILSDLTQTLNQLGEDAQKLTVLFISVDPERDTPDRLALYLSNFHERMIGLTGDKQEIQAVASSLGVFFEQRADSSPESLFFDHTATVMVIDPEGYLRVVFPPMTSSSHVAEDLSSLIR